MIKYGKIKHMLDVITIGSATWDNFLHADYPLKEDEGSPTGKSIILHLGAKYSADDFYATIGGNAANASVTFTRQGFKTACLAKIGNDLVADQFEQRLKQEGVSRKLLIRSKDKPTAYSTILLHKEGDRTILSYHGASDDFSFDDIQLKKMKSKWWYLSLAGESYKMFDQLLDFAKENNIDVGFNPSGYHIKHGKKGILRRLKDLTFLVLNEEEAAELTGIPFQREKEVFKKLDDLMPGIVAVTNGPKGVTVSDGRNIFRAGVFQEKFVADRTGAGDSFGAGFIAGLMESKTRKNKGEEFSVEDLKLAIRLATANATSVVEHVGATEGTLTKDQFENDDRWKELDVKIESI